MLNHTKSGRAAVFTRIMLLAWSASYIASAQQTVLPNANVVTPPNYGTMQPPAVGSSYVDSTFNTTITRITNAPQTPNTYGTGNLPWINDEYSSVSAFNSDNSYFILVHLSYFGLYQGNGTFVRSLPAEIGASSEPRWARTNNTTLYYHVNNALKSYDVVSQQITTVHTFTEYSQIYGYGEMDISLDGDHLVFAGDQQNIFVYEISTGTKYTAWNTGGRTFDSLYITPDNNVIISWITAGTGRYTGQELFDKNMNFLRQVGHADGHKHVTRDTNGDEVLIWTNSNDSAPPIQCQNGIVKIQLSTGNQTCLLQLDWRLAVHITAPDGNGTAFVETYDPLDPVPGTSDWKEFTNELIEVTLDGATVTRLANHRSQPNGRVFTPPVQGGDYYYQPRMTVSRDGSRLLYCSNFNLETQSDPDYGDVYMITVSNPGGGGPGGNAVAWTSLVGPPQVDPQTGAIYRQPGTQSYYATAESQQTINSGVAATFTLTLNSNGSNGLFLGLNTVGQPISNAIYSLSGFSTYFDLRYYGTWISSSGVPHAGSKVTISTDGAGNVTFALDGVAFGTLSIPPSAYPLQAFFETAVDNAGLSAASFTMP